MIITAENEYYKIIIENKHSDAIEDVLIDLKNILIALTFQSKTVEDAICNMAEDIENARSEEMPKV